MPTTNSTLSSYGAAIARTADSFNLNSQTLFKRAGLDSDALKNPNARYPDDQLARLLEMAAKKADMGSGFGLSVARFVTPTTLHALGFSVLASEHLLAALLRLTRYYRIVSNGALIALDKGKHDYRLQLRFNQKESLPHEWHDAVIATLLTICRWLKGNDFAPLRVNLRRPKPNLQEPFEFFFNAPVQYGCQQDSLVFDKDSVLVELPTSNAELAYQNDKIVADYLARFNNVRLSERVRAIFIERLVTGKFSEEQTAEQLNLSLRSLQRRLSEEQTSYQQLLDETRLDLALQYINRTSLTVAQIAPLVGFSDSSNFNRAFKRWLGISPSKYRAVGFS